MIDQRIDTHLNPWGLMTGEIVTSEAFTGIYRIAEIKRVEDKLQATCYQIFTLDGKPVKLNRPAVCDMKQLRPAILQIAQLRERIQHLQNLVGYLERIKETHKL